jgi:hypothetical protein
MPSIPIFAPFMTTIIQCITSAWPNRSRPLDLTKSNRITKMQKLKIMKPKQILALSLAISIVLTSSKLKAQEAEVSPPQGAQFTFAYPLGTNGVEAISESNEFSFNLLYGVNGGLNGLEIGGLANYNHGEVQGVQLAGIANINREQTSGLMWACAFNLTFEETRGVQLADFNVAAGDFTGVQAGVVNYAGRMRGVQFGLINIVGEDNGALPIGLINVVRGGYYALELVSSEAVLTHVNYKMGVEHFYTIFKIGYSRYHHNNAYSLGLGFGSMFTLADRHKLSVDLSVSEIVYNEEWNSDNNYLSKLDLSYRYSLGEHISLIAGPSLNWYATEMGMDDGAAILNIPSHAHSFNCDDYQNWTWLGFNAGIAYKF